MFLTQVILNSYLLDQDYYLDNIDHLKYYYNTVFISQNIYNDAFKNKILKLNAKLYFQQ